MLIGENICSRHLVIKRTLSTDAFLRISLIARYRYALIMFVIVP